MTVAAERNDKIATVRYLTERKFGRHTAEIHRLDSKNIVITICHFPPYEPQTAW